MWEWYRWRIDAVRAATPNAGHVAVAEWARHADVTVVTQNVDRLHQRAGSDDVHELHGTILRLRCERPECRDGDGIVPEPAPPSPGRCACGSRRRPAVVWFGEMLPPAPMSAALSALQAADLVVVVGTSSLVEPAASLPHVALSRGVCVIEVNPEPTPLSARATFTLRARAGEALPPLVSALSAPLDMG